MEQRKLGNSPTLVSALGLGCWAIGGPWTFNGRQAGWGAVDDEESIRAIHRALDLGVSLFDTADAYGCGHSERVLGRALGDRRGDVVIATKFGLCFDEVTRSGGGADASPAYIRRACEASLRRLGTDYIDLYQLHAGADDAESAARVVEVLEDLFAEGKIRAYGTSADAIAVARVFAAGPHCAAVQTQANVFGVDEELLAFAERAGLAVLARSPLAMGLLTGKYIPGQRMPPVDDVRRHTPHWTYFRGEAMGAWLDRIAAIRHALTGDGRTLAQGAIGWIWSRSAATIPIPGFRTVVQVEENARAMDFGPLSPGAFASVNTSASHGEASARHE